MKITLNLCHLQLADEHGNVWWPRAAIVKKKQQQQKKVAYFRKNFCIKKIINKVNLLRL